MPGIDRKSDRQYYFGTWDENLKIDDKSNDLVNNKPSGELFDQLHCKEWVILYLLTICKNVQTVIIVSYMLEIRVADSVLYKFTV